MATLLQMPKSIFCVWNKYLVQFWKLLARGWVVGEGVLERKRRTTSMWCGRHTHVPQTIGFCGMAPCTSVCLPGPWRPPLAVYHVVNSAPGWFTAASQTAWSLCVGKNSGFHCKSCLVSNKTNSRSIKMNLVLEWISHGKPEFGKRLWSTPRKREGNVATMRPKQSKLHSASEVKSLLENMKIRIDAVEQQTFQTYTPNHNNNEKIKIKMKARMASLY